ncbi:MAG: alpha/beta hydrolase [Bacteroidota bacterium]
MNPTVQSEQGFKYIEKGNGPVLLLLHGLFGALSNFRDVFEAFSTHYKVIIPIIPIYEQTKVKSSVEGYTQYIEEFVDYKGIDKATLLGNSLGGHIALVYTLKRPEKVESLILTASSGLFESGMGTGFPRRGSYEYVAERVAYTFYSPKVATKPLIDDVFGIVNDNYKTLRVLKIARSAQRHNMRDDLNRIHVPTLLIWGLNDNITPPHVAHEFDKLIPDTELRFIDKCGHAPMMEHPEVFNQYLRDFLNKHVKVTTP